ncbi:MAG: cache domain-containing protein, partial [Anaerolineales bacterium]|nr:cache domain-containing protein [Anaerolineales bacterium]
LILSDKVGGKITAIMRRWFKFHQDLGLQLLALYLFLTVPFLITLATFDRIVGEHIRRDIQANDLSLARAIALETDISIRDSLKSVSELSTYPSVIDLNDAGMETVFQVAMDTSPNVNLIYRLDENGIMRFHYPIGPVSTVGTDFSFRKYFQDSLLSFQPLISEGRISPTTNQAVATAVMPVYSVDGKYLGLVGMNMRLESLSNTLAAIFAEHAADEGFEVLILDSAGQVIAHPNSEYLLKTADQILPDVYKDVLGGNSGSIIEMDLGGVERLYTYVSIPTVGWGVVISRPTSAAFATQILLRRVVILAAGTFILIGLFFWGTLAIRVIRPIERLVPISEAIGLNHPID